MQTQTFDSTESLEKVDSLPFFRSNRPPLSILFKDFLDSEIT